MDHGGLAIAAGTSAHLVELDGAKRHVVEHDMADIGQVDTLAKGGGRNDAAEASVSECFLHATAIGTRKPRVIERDMGCAIGHTLAQRLGERHGLVARIDVNDGLLPRRHDRHQTVLAARKVAVVLELQVLAHRLVDHRASDRQHAGKLGHDRSRRGGRRSHNDRVAQGFEDIGHVKIGATVAALGKAGVVCLIDNDKADAARTRETVTVDRQELGRREHDTGAARS